MGLATNFLGFILKNIAHNFYNMQKDRVFALQKHIIFYNLWISDKDIDVDPPSVT